MTIEANHHLNRRKNYNNLCPEDNFNSLKKIKQNGEIKVGK